MAAAGQEHEQRADVELRGAVAVVGERQAVTSKLEGEDRQDHGRGGCCCCGQRLEQHQNAADDDDTGDERRQSNRYLYQQQQELVTVKKMQVSSVPTCKTSALLNAAFHGGRTHGSKLPVLKGEKNRKVVDVREKETNKQRACFLATHDNLLFSFLHLCSKYVTYQFWSTRYTVEIPPVELAGEA